MKIRVEANPLVNQHQSGIAQYTRMLIETLAKDRQIKTYATYFNFLNRQKDPSLSGIKIEKNASFPLRVYSKLQSLSLAPPFDIFLPHVELTIFPNFACWPTAKSKLRATVIHDLTYIYFPDTVEAKNLEHLRRVVPRAISDSDFIITISESVKNELVKELGMDPSRCVITVNTPDDRYFKRNNNEIHKKYGIPTKKFIYFIGNLEPRKDLPTLIAAYRKLPANLKKEYSLVMAGGKGWKTEKSQKAISDAKKAGENVVHVGFVQDEDMAAFYQKASLFVMPSIYEGFGIPPLEAMASKCPVVATDIPVLREVCGDAALFAEISDSDSFAKQIQVVLNNDKISQDLIKKGTKNLERFSWTENVNRLRLKVDELLAQK